jgi:hypothetical protein
MNLAKIVSMIRTVVNGTLMLLAINLNLKEDGTMTHQLIFTTAWIEHR